MQCFKHYTYQFFALITVYLLTSCSTTDKIVYLQDAGTDVSIKKIIQTPVTAQPDDKISIIINSKDPELADMFNLPIMTHRIGQPMNNTYNYNQQVSSYTVDPEGNIDFPILGKIHVAGMQREKIASHIKNEIVKHDLVKDAVVIVEFMNMSVSVTGEVNHPGRFNMDRDRLTILDALSMAGDLTIYGERENVLVVRRENDSEIYYRVNLCDSKSLHASPAYYLRQNDMVYVAPNNVRARQSTLNGNNVRSTAFWLSLSSLLTTLCILIFK